jgi:hypothetical protein
MTGTAAAVDLTNTKGFLTLFQSNNFGTDDTMKQVPNPDKNGLF